MDLHQVVSPVEWEDVPDVIGEGGEAVENGAASTREMSEAGGMGLHQFGSPVEWEDVPDVLGEEGDVPKARGSPEMKEGGVDAEGKGTFPGEKTEEKTLEYEGDAVTKLENKKNQLQYAENAIHAQEYVHTIGKVAETVEIGAAEAQEMAEAGGIDLDHPMSALDDAGITGEGAKEVFNADAIEYEDAAGVVGDAWKIQDGGGVDGLDPQLPANIENGVTNVADTVAGADSAADAGRQLTEDAIVDGHKFHECIDDTCLEVPVRCVAENCAVPCYECIAINICMPFCTCFCKCCCNAGADRTVENTEEAAHGTAEVAEVTEGVMGMSGLLDASQLCMTDALCFALPFIGVILSCFRLYQGTTLSCRGCIGAWGAVGKERTAFQWMVFEGQLRLGQGCCGLLGAAPGLIILTMPSIFTLSFMAGKARKTRLGIEGDDKGDGHGPESNAEKTYSFPDSTERAKTFHETYKVISGRAKDEAQQSVDYTELMESGLVSSEPKFIYPDVPRGKWSTGIFDCMRHIPSCLTGCFCGCIIYGQVAEGARLFKGVFYVTLIIYILFYFIGFAPLLWTIYALCLVAESRKRIAEEYGIRLNPVENVCLAFFCSCCAATQVARHMFGWGENNLCEGGLELGPKPIIRWRAMPRRVSSIHQMGSVGYSSNSHQVETDGQVVDAPTTMLPMMR